MKSLIMKLRFLAVTQVLEKNPPEKFPPNQLSPGKSPREILTSNTPNHLINSKPLQRLFLHLKLRP